MKASTLQPKKGVTVKASTLKLLSQWLFSKRKSLFQIAADVSTLSPLAKPRRFVTISSLSVSQHIFSIP